MNLNFRGNLPEENAPESDFHGALSIQLTSTETISLSFRTELYSITLPTPSSLTNVFLWIINWFDLKVNVPKYYGWYRYTEFFGIKKNALYKKNHFYTIESDENEENFYVKRYKMILNNS